MRIRFVHVRRNKLVETQGSTNRAPSPPRRTVFTIVSLGVVRGIMLYVLLGFARPTLLSSSAQPNNFGILVFYVILLSI